MRAPTRIVFTWLWVVASLSACDPQEAPPVIPLEEKALPDAMPVNEPNPAQPAAAESAAAENELLATEAPERDPASEMVKLRLDVAPRGAAVWWGKQKLGEAPVAIERPRRSGPLNIVVKADGYLDHHTRLFTDRDDRLSVSLVRPREAVRLLGFKRRPGMGLPTPDGGVPELSAAPRMDAGTPLPP